MASVKGSQLPRELFYDVENGLWYRPRGGGVVEIGMTSVALAMAAALVAVTPKRAGRRIEKGEACAVVETGKTVSAARVALSGFIEESNEVLLGEPFRASRDPYGEGWLIRLRADDWQAASATLLPGDKAAKAYALKLRREKSRRRAEEG